MMRARMTGQQGVTLVELMLAMALGLIVALAAMTLMMTSRSAYQTIDESSRLEDNGRFVLDIASRAIRQAGYINWDRPEGPYLLSDRMTPMIRGLDAHTLPASSVALASPVPAPATLNGSDVLAVRFFGAGPHDKPDGTVLDCAGFAVGEPASEQDALDDIPGKSRGWSIFYVGVSKEGEPALYCKYHHDGKWQSAALTDGVESFQVLYGIAAQEEGVATRFMRATEINALDQAQQDKQDSWWHKVTAVRIALLLRGSGNIPRLADGTTYHLLGPAYEKVAAADEHASITDTQLPAETRNRFRKVFSSTIALRNRARPEAD